MGSKKKLVTFEMFKPNMKSGRMIFDIKSIGDSGKDKLTGLQDKKISDVSIFIDNSSSSVPACNLSGVDLEGVTLPQMTCTDGNCTSTPANLNGADLSFVDFSYMNSTYPSDLSRTEMNGANLTNACLCGANAYKIKLNGANLTNADFTGVDLRNAELSGATWNNTICPDGNPNKGTLPCTGDPNNIQPGDQLNAKSDFQCNCCLLTGEC